MSIAFTPRNYQGLIIDQILDMPRTAIWAGMGLGKSVATLTALDTIQMLDSRPILVVAPLRVARTTWPDEARKWAHLNHLHVLPIVGSERERLAALRQDANIYTTNFESLPWLVDQYDKRPWPFSTVVIDESTKLKGFRLRQGTARAKALARVAHTQVERFIELTGTPSPNGLADLWGQIWFLDKGHRLGRTFDDFKKRWFRKSYDGYGTEPMEFAQDQIQRALRDLCLTIDAKDWFDLREPIVNNIYVDLPAAARAKYEDMEKRMFMELSGHEVEAFGAAARTVKCIAEGTEMLTSNGWKAIEDWAPGDQLWDGVEWVSADNLVCNGYMPVINCRGVCMTPDHKVLTQSHGWVTAEEINNASESGRPNWASFRLPDGYLSGRFDVDHSSEAGAMEGQVRVRERDNDHRVESDQHQARGEEVLRVPTGRDAAGCLGNARYDRAPGLGDVVQHALSLLQRSRQGLAELWRAGHFSLSALARVVRRFLGRHGADVRCGLDARTGAERGRLRAGELPMEGPHRAGEQPEGQRSHRDARGLPDGLPGGAGVRNQTGDAGAAIAGRVAGGSRTHSAKVYDLVNCGPRHRFVVRNPDGQLLIVHNCLQMANGAAYVDDAGNWIEVHDAKLQALEEVVEEAAGMPVLVAYNFKSDLARLSRAFPKGRALDSDPDTIRQWNEGRIPILFAHPASAGHGLNLQDGGNILVFFGHDWNLENRLQIIERIGPTRQMQAGHDRPMFIHNIIAAGTVDEMVMERVETKRATQDILLAAMKVKGYR